MSAPYKSTAEVLNFRYFCDELIRFREFIGKRNTTREQRENAFHGFSMVYFMVNVSPEEQSRMATLFESQYIEYEKREFLRLLHDI
jgi:hypothetical protein